MFLFFHQKFTLNSQFEEKDQIEKNEDIIVYLEVWFIHP